MFYLLFIIFIFLTKNAFAYIDPGTGGIIIQAIIGGIATISIFFYKFKLKIKDLITKLFKKTKIDKKN